ncbi:MAG: hypothetical protein Q8O88_03060 [bacterium]|nr:hypothetical protein [bacterium]
MAVCKPIKIFWATGITKEDIHLVKKSIENFLVFAKAQNFIRVELGGIFETKSHKKRFHKYSLFARHLDSGSLIEGLKADQIKNKKNITAS